MAPCRARNNSSSCLPGMPTLESPSFTLPEAGGRACQAVADARPPGLGVRGSFTGRLPRSGMSDGGTRLTATSRRASSIQRPSKSSCAYRAPPGTVPACTADRSRSRLPPVEVPVCRAHRPGRVAHKNATIPSTHPPPIAGRGARAGTDKVGLGRDVVHPISGTARGPSSRRGADIDPLDRSTPKPIRLRVSFADGLARLLRRFNTS